MIKHGKPKEKREKLIPFYLVSRVLRLRLETRLRASKIAFLKVCGVARSHASGNKVSRLWIENFDLLTPAHTYGSVPQD